MCNFPIDNALINYKKIQFFFCVDENIFVDIDVDADAAELNDDVLRTSGHTEFDKDYKINEFQFNEEDYDGHDNDEIEEEKDNFD